MIGEQSEKALERWKETGPDAGLTWGQDINGDKFIELAKKYNLFSPEKNILELGPGYGRILKSIISKNVPFKHYTGIDISKKNIDMLRKNFNKPNIEFLEGSFTEVSLDRKYDVVLSSLTLKHQFPTFYNSLKNITNFVNNGGKFFFDLLENNESFRIF